jgi:hypothetical protein
LDGKGVISGWKAISIDEESASMESKYIDEGVTRWKVAGIGMRWGHIGMEKIPDGKIHLHQHRHWQEVNRIFVNEMLNVRCPFAQCPVKPARRRSCLVMKSRRTSGRLFWKGDSNVEL